MVPLSFDGASIRLREYGRYLRGFEVARRPPWRLFERHSQYFGTLHRDSRFVLHDEGEETAQRRQPAVTGIYRRSPFPLDVLEKGKDILPCEVLQTEGRDGLVSTLSDES